MSKRKEEKREQEYYRKRIGEKLEEAYLSIPMGEPPSEETIKKWIQIADQKRAQRLKRKRILLSSAAAVVLCAGVCATCILHTPEAVAGNSGEVKIEEGMDAVDVYETQVDLPDDAREIFLVFSDFIGEYQIDQVKVEQNETMQKLSLVFKNNNKQEIFIEETLLKDFLNIGQQFDGNVLKEKWGDIDVYITEYQKTSKKVVYSFMYGEKVFVNINVPFEMEKNIVKGWVEDAVNA